VIRAAWGPGKACIDAAQRADVLRGGALRSIRPRGHNQLVPPNTQGTAGRVRLRLVRFVAV